MRRTDLDIRIDIDGPLLTQSSEPGGFGLDIIMARTVDNLPYIPGTLLSGKLDQAWQEIQDAVQGTTSFVPAVERWLGKRSENDFPHRKQLFFSDLVLLAEHFTESESQNIQHRVAIDKKRGAASRRQLVTMESPFLQGRRYCFKGTITYFASDLESDEIEKYINIGLRWLTQIGAMRTIGYGRIVAINITSQNRALSTCTSTTADVPEKIWLKISPEHPFCLADSPVADNLFESKDIIPGSAILGSIVTTWNFLAGGNAGQVCDIPDSDRKELKENFNRLRITHAFPSEKDHYRPVVFPQSLVKIIKGGKTELYDVALCKRPCLIRKQVPAFAIDWKDATDVKNDFGWTPVPKELRIRTGIDPVNLRSAENELFSYEQVVPDRHSWYAELDLADLDEAARKPVFSQLCSLVSQGIMGLGKTKTPFSIEFLWPSEQVSLQKQSNLQPVNGKQWIITLQTDTLLGCPEKLSETSGQDELWTMYADAWHELSAGQLTLVRHFSRQRLAGGLWRHQTMHPGRPYKPWLLTEAGSVFVLEAGSEISGAREVMEQWFNHGLTLDERTRKYYELGDDSKGWWRQCPYIPRNGFGEIAVNLKVHCERYNKTDYIEVETLST